MKKDSLNKLTSEKEDEVWLMGIAFVDKTEN